MKQLRRCVSPVCAAVLSALALNSHAALYKVIEIEVSEDGEINTYALDGASPNEDSGVVVGAGTVSSSTGDGDIDYSDDESDTDGESEDSDLNGDDDDEDYLDDLDDSDLRYMSAYAQSYAAILTDDLSEWIQVNVWDEILDYDGLYRGTTNEYFYGVNDNGFAVGYGSAPYYVYTYTDEDTHDETYAIIRDFSARGFVYKVGDDPDGTPVELPPEETEYGGVSVAYDISDGGLVAGYSSVSVVYDMDDEYDDCIYDDNLPEVLCEYNMANDIYGGTYQLEAYMWQLDGDGNVESTYSLGHPADLAYDSTVQVTGRAYAVNENGYAVGSADYYITPDDPSTSSMAEYAMIYTTYSTNDQGILDITDRDYYEYMSSDTVSRAVDINNNNVVIGHAYRLINGYSRAKAWYYDLDANEPTVVEIPSTYESSAMTAKSINDDNMVVGEYEWEFRPGSVTRDRHGYLYDINSETLIDLNDAIECTDEFEIVEANVIRNDGVILATATFEEPYLDSNGDPTFDSNGDEVTYIVARTIALEPIDGGDYESCANADEDEIDEDNERSGASFGLWGLLLPVAWLTRRRYTLSR